MARRTPLKTHLLGAHAPHDIRTVCGMSAIPNQGQSFAPPGEHSTTWRGIVPGTVGVGIVVASSLGFDHESAPGGLCGSCQPRYAAGEGI